MNSNTNSPYASDDDRTSYEFESVTPEVWDEPDPEPEVWDEPDPEPEVWDEPDPEPEVWDEPDPEPESWDDKDIGCSSVISEDPYFEPKHFNDNPCTWEPRVASIPTSEPTSNYDGPTTDYSVEELLETYTCIEDPDDYLSTSPDNLPSSSDSSTNPQKRAKRLAALAE